MNRERWREQVVTMVAEAEAPAAVPPGLESGTISTFDDGTSKAEFGAGWELSTDQIAGGKSTGEIKVISPGAAGSSGSLHITGVIDPGLPYAWSGAMFSPGAVPFTPANLSSRKTIHFSARGDGKTYRIMLFAQSSGQVPTQETFVAGPEWKEFVFPFSAFGGNDGSDVMAIIWVGGPGGGAFDFQIDNVRLE